ncbi:BpuSI family type II restriction endonuclease [Streptococcus thermophilus]|nr:N-6 DNA methylase [Streptococcus thermophilus]MCE2100038.1 N-6 DNA methylase [Streptococcus thermophilus]
MKTLTLPKYTDDEVGVFHPICELALNEALNHLNLDKDYSVVHHYAIGQIIPDYVIVNNKTNKIFLIVEVKRTPSQVKSTRYKDQARSYILEAGPQKLETPYYVLTNLEVTNFFKYDEKRTSVNKQMIAPSPLLSGYFENRSFDFDKLVKSLEECINIARANRGRFLWGYGDVVEVLERYDVNFNDWHTAFTVIAYEFIRSVLGTSPATNNWKSALYYKNNPGMLQNNISRVNFSTLTTPQIGGNNDVWEQQFLKGVKELADNSSDADELTSAIHEYLVKNKSHLGIVPTDLELATALVSLTVDKNNFDSTKIICDPAAGGGNLIAALIEYISINPKQIKANDISPDLSHLLSLRLGLRFPNSISPTNSPLISNENILDLPHDYFSDVAYLLLNPPYLSGVTDKKMKTKIFNRLHQLKNIKPVTQIGQMPLEGPFLEYLLEKLNVGTKIGIVFPKSHLFGLGKESQAIRKLLVENFGLEKIFLYPRDNLFRDVVKETVILIGEIGSSKKEVTLIQTSNKVSDININDLANLCVTDEIEIKYISLQKLKESIHTGWQSFLSNFDINSEITKSVVAPMKFPELYRGKAGNKGGTDFLFVSKHSSWNKIKDTIPNEWLFDAIENTKDIEEDDKYLSKTKLKCLAPPASAFIKGSQDYLLLENILHTIQRNTSKKNQGKQLKKEKSISDIRKIIQNDSAQIVPAGSLILPRNLRKTFKAYITSKPMVISTNFFVIEKQNNYDLEVVYSWLFSVFGQIQLESNSKLQEGTRKSEKAAFGPIIVPNIINAPVCNQAFRGFYEFGNSNKLDLEWGNLLGLTDTQVLNYNIAMYDLIMRRNP